MEYLSVVLDVVLHLDKHLEILVRNYGVWIYAILFLVVFCETGLIVTPFLPGDSLLFVSGALAALGGMDIALLIAVLMLAASLGDSVNYHIGRFAGPWVFKWEDSFFFNRESLKKTETFYEKHGGKTLVIARFLPIIRTFAPFVAGVGRMNYARFIVFNVSGAALWTLSLTLAGYFLGNLPWVRKNLSFVMLGIIAVSLLPGLIGAWLERGESRTN
ncbi:MAG: DedA family protein [Candidatus Accumulibacter sp.]|jgi:membrane-associated protein|nr:DedA family protein [Accumulibacter sp.]